MKESNSDFDQIAYQNNYIKQKYDRINLTVPKGRKEEIKKKALEEGKSVNEYINMLIDRDDIVRVFCAFVPFSKCLFLDICHFEKCACLMRVVFKALFI